MYPQNFNGHLTTYSESEIAFLVCHASVIHRITKCLIYLDGISLKILH